MTIEDTLENICLEEYQDISYVPHLAAYNYISDHTKLYPNFMLVIPTKHRLKQWILDGGNK